MNPKWKKPRMKSRRPVVRKPRFALARRMLFNPQPVFTETFRHSAIQLQNGFASSVLGVTMDSVPQLSQYSNLYQKYRILKVLWTILPAQTSYDVSTTTFTSNYQSCPRVVYAINDSTPVLPGGPTIPPNEAFLLQDNGCKIRQGDKLIKISHRPVPQTMDTSNPTSVGLNFRGKYISFPAGAQPNTTHWGVAISFTNVGVWNAPVTVDPSYIVYCKVTFQLADPR